MARVLIVGCGCRGQALAGELAGAGHAVRGTTRDPARVAGIEAAGAEGAVADPDRLGTVMAQLAGVSVVCWLMGSVDARSATALHGPRLQTLLERLVDTPCADWCIEGAERRTGLLADGAARCKRRARGALPVVGDGDPTITMLLSDCGAGAPC